MSVLRPNDAHEPEFSLEARVRWMVSVAVPFDQPYGGPRWPQREGYPIYEEILRSTEAAVWDALDTVTVVDDAQLRYVTLVEGGFETEMEIIESHEVLSEEVE